MVAANKAVANPVIATTHWVKGAIVYSRLVRAII